MAVSDYDQIFEDAGRSWNVDPNLLKAVMQQESRGNPNVSDSSAGARGLMQIRDPTGRALGITNPYDPPQAIFGAAKLMSQLLDRYGSPEKALVAYSGGAQNYVPSVAAHYVAFRRSQAAAKPSAAGAGPSGSTSQTDGKPDPLSRLAPEQPSAQPSAPQATGNGAAAPATSPADPLSRLAPEQAPANTTTPPPATPYGLPPPSPGEGPATVSLGGSRQLTSGPASEGPEGGVSDLFTGADAQRVIQTTKQAYASGDPYGVLAKPAQDWIAANVPGGTSVINPLAQIIAKDLAAGGAGVGATLWEIGNALGGPSLGRDFNILAQTVPMHLLSSGGTLGPEPGGYLGEKAQRPAVIEQRVADVTAPPAAATTAETATPTWRPIEPGDVVTKTNTRTNPQTGEMEINAPPPAAAAGPQPSTGSAMHQAETPAEHAAWVGDTKAEIDRVVAANAAEGGPQSLSAAATPPSQATLSPRAAKAYRRMAELNQIVTPIEGEDATTYVAGSKPTEAEWKGNPTVSQVETLTRQKDPDAFEARLAANNRARVKAVEDITPSDPQLEDIRERMATRDAANEKAILEKAGPTDLSATAQMANELLKDPRIAEQPRIVKVLQPIRDALYDADGNLKSNPRAAWGIFDRIGADLEAAKNPLEASSGEKYAFNQLVGLRKTVSDAMVKSTDGAFQKFLDDHAEFAKQITAGRLLRDFVDKRMTAKNGMIYADRFYKFVTDLAIRRGNPGIDPAMDIPDQTVQTLINVNQDLKRSARIDLGKPRGSPTNLFFELARGLGIGGTHLGVQAIFPTAGPMTHMAVRAGTAEVARRIGAMRARRLVRNALAEPPPTAARNPNPLAGP